MQVVKVTLERLECDVCGDEAVRYTVSYPDGMKVLDRCERHAKKVLALRDEAGNWSAFTPSTKGKLTVLSPEEINSRRK